MGEVIIQIDITYDCVSEVMDQVYLKIIVGSWDCEMVTVVQVDLLVKFISRWVGEIVSQVYLKLCASCVDDSHVGEI